MAHFFFSSYCGPLMGNCRSLCSSSCHHFRMMLRQAVTLKRPTGCYIAAFSACVTWEVKRWCFDAT